MIGRVQDKRVYFSWKGGWEKFDIFSLEVEVYRV